METSAFTPFCFLTLAFFNTTQNHVSLLAESALILCFATIKHNGFYTADSWAFFCVILQICFAKKIIIQCDFVGCLWFISAKSVCESAAGCLNRTSQYERSNSKDETLQKQQMKSWFELRTKGFFPFEASRPTHFHTLLLTAHKPKCFSSKWIGRSTRTLWRLLTKISGVGHKPNAFCGHWLKKIQCTVPNSDIRIIFH